MFRGLVFRGMVQKPGKDARRRGRAHERRPDEEPVGPGDFIRLDKAAIEYVKDWATIITAVISVVYTIVLINETTK